MRERFGLCEWFHPARMHAAGKLQHEISRMRHAFFIAQMCGLHRFRVNLSWADWLYFDHQCNAEQPFYDCLFDEATQQGIRLLTTVFGFPDSYGIVPSPASPPKPEYYDYYEYFLTQSLARWGEPIEAVQFGNEVTSPTYWNPQADPDLSVFRFMTVLTADIAHAFRKEAVLAGLSPIDQTFFEAVKWDCVNEKVDAVALHGFPGTYGNGSGRGKTWAAHAEGTRTVLEGQCYRTRRIIISEAGAATRLGEEGQVVACADLIHALETVPHIEQAYFFSVHDYPRRFATMQEEVQGFAHSEDDRHMGLLEVTETGYRSKLLLRLLVYGGFGEVCAEARRRGYETPLQFL